jgi:hypothetical protein
MRTLSQLVDWASNPNIDQPTITTQSITWLNGMLGFSAVSVVDSQGGSSALTLGNAAGAFQWKPKASIRDLYNAVRGKYVCPANNWQQSDIPYWAADARHGYSNGPAECFYDANLAQDGGDRRWLDLQFPFTISSATVQRLAKIELLRRRQQGTGTFAWNMWMYQTTALDVVECTLPLLRWQDKLLEIQAHRMTLNKQNINGTDVTLLGTEIDLQETDPGVYSWSTTEELSPAGYKQATLPARGDIATQIDYSTVANTPTITVNGE